MKDPVKQYMYEHEIRHLRVILDIDNPTIMKQYIKRRIDQIERKIAKQSW